VTRAILDDHLLRDLLADDIPEELDELLAGHEPATTNHYLYRLCRSVVSAPGGPLTGAWSAERRRALGARLVELPAGVEVVPMRALAYRIAELSGEYPVSTLGAEAIAASERLDAPLRLVRGRRPTDPRRDGSTRAGLPNRPSLIQPPTDDRGHPVSSFWRVQLMAR
jgi:hypothetical protein